MNSVENRPMRRWCSKCKWAVKTAQGYTLCAITKQRKNLNRGYKCKRYMAKPTGAEAGELKTYFADPSGL